MGRILDDKCQMNTDEFRQRVFQLLHDIPAGRVTSYGRLARLAGHPGRARMVGRILKSLPGGSRLPWHRVVTAAGKSAFPAGSEAALRQLDKLAREGVTANASGRLPQSAWWP